jgi:tetratricopeptide (TPR) repeat protein
MSRALRFPPMSADHESRAAFEQAAGLVQLRRWPEAAAVYSRLLLGGPDDVRALCGMSRCLGQLGRARDGLALAERAAALAPDDDWPHRLRSAHLLALGRAGDALRSAAEAARRDPGGLPALLTVFEAQVGRRDGEGASATAGQLLALHAGEPEAHNCVGRAAMMRRAWAEAEAAFRAALAMRPLTPAYLCNVALAMERQGRRSEAIELFQRAVRTDPGDAVARDQLVRALDRARWRGLGRLDESVRRLYQIERRRRSLAGRLLPPL